MSNKTITFFKALGIIILSRVLPLVLLLPYLFLVEKKVLSETNITITISRLIVYILTIIVFFIIFKKELKNNIKDFKTNYKKHLITAIKFYIVGLFIMYTSSLIIKHFFNINNVNQENNINAIKELPVLQIILTTLLVPILEEITYRLSFKGFTNNKHIFAITTGLIFAFAHVISSLDKPLSLLYLIPYGAMGISFGYTYYKTNNIISTITIHSFHNIITIIGLFLFGGI